MTSLCRLSHHSGPGYHDVAEVCDHPRRGDKWGCLLLRRFCCICILLWHPELIGGSLYQRLLKQGKRQHISGLVLLAILRIELAYALVVSDKQGQHDLLCDTHLL